MTSIFACVYVCMVVGSVSKCELDYYLRCVCVGVKNDIDICVREVTAYRNGNSTIASAASVCT